MLLKILKKAITENPLKFFFQARLGRSTQAMFISSQYWDERYRKGGSSGAGSYGRLAEFKAEVLNDFVTKNTIQSVIEFGTGDGNQLKLASYPLYIGIDVSEIAVRAASELFDDDSTKTFVLLEEYNGSTAELSLSLDVVYHLIEDEVYETYMKNLFDAAERFVIVYASNYDNQPSVRHVRHRKFTNWVSANRADFHLIEKVPNKFPFDRKDQNNTSFADFYVFERLQ